LEVLALGLAGKRADGRPLDTVLGELEGEALAVLPWGAGKWLGRRGRLVREARERREVLLGDNGGRPAFWREPLLEGARALAGSDPLPLPGRERKIGSYGSSLQAHISEERPGADLIAALRTAPLEPFGAPESPMGFLRDQLELRLGRG